MQNALIHYEFWPKVGNYSHSLKNILRREEVENFYRKLIDADSTEVIDFNGLELADVNFTGANFLRDVHFIFTEFLDDISFVEANFHGFALFGGATDSDQKTNFRSQAFFTETRFYYNVFFKEVQFSDGCDFQNAEFCDII